MRTVLILLVAFLFSYCLNAQIVEVDGKLKVNTMDPDNSLEQIVVKKPDGELATRMVASLPPPNSDTTRTLASDLELARLICECTNIPPFLVQSALDGGYTVEDLYKGGVSSQDLMNGGVSVFELAPLVDSYYDLYGLKYGGGILLDFETSTNKVVVLAENDYYTSIGWGCAGIEITGADSPFYGDGPQNTQDIVDECWEGAAYECYYLTLNGYDDWYLPANNAWVIIHGHLIYEGLGNFQSVIYWTSTEINANEAYVMDNTGGSTYQGDKFSSYYFRPARTFFE
jgi:hypothetical protein